MKDELSGKGFSLIETCISVMLVIFIFTGIVCLNAILQTKNRQYVMQEEQRYAMSHAAGLIERDVRYCDSYSVTDSGCTLTITKAGYVNGGLIVRRIKYYPSIFGSQKVLRRAVAETGRDYAGFNICLYDVEYVSFARQDDNDLLSIAFKDKTGIAYHKTVVPVQMNRSEYYEN